jgi:ribulose-5-phosphate 4-epimerase/fuculose-1-phosphate aldolase
VTDSEQTRAAELVTVARSLFERGYSFGTAGNLSVRVGSTILVTPTGSSMSSLTADGLARVECDGSVIGDIRPSKEAHFHLAIYRVRPQCGAVVHLHSTYATAVSCLRDLDVEDALPVLTPYYAMRIPKLPVVPYLPPGDPALAGEVAQRAACTPALLLRNHGPITAGATLAEAAALSEELEEAARLYFLLGDRAQPLSTDQVAELRRRYR